MYTHTLLLQDLKVSCRHVSSAYSVYLSSQSLIYNNLKNDVDIFWRVPTLDVFQNSTQFGFVHDLSQLKYFRFCVLAIAYHQEAMSVGPIIGDTKIGPSVKVVGAPPDISIAKTSLPLPGIKTPIYVTPDPNTSVHCPSLAIVLTFFLLMCNTSHTYFLYFYALTLLSMFHFTCK